MRVATLKDSPAVLKMSTGKGNSRVDSIMARLKGGRFITFIDDDSTACFAYEPVTDGVWQAHTMSVPSIRGKELRDFAHDTAIEMCVKYGMEDLMMFCFKKDRLMQIFVSWFGLSRIASVGKFIVYAASKEQILNFKK